MNTKVNFKKYMCCADIEMEDYMTLVKSGKEVIFEIQESEEINECVININDIEDMIKFLQDFVKGD